MVWMVSEKILYINYWRKKYGKGNFCVETKRIPNKQKSLVSRKLKILHCCLSDPESKCPYPSTGWRAEIFLICTFN